MNFKSCIPAFLLLAILVSVASAQNVLKVPSQYKTIQAAIDAAKDYDTVLVDPGTYSENIDFKGKKITVISSGGSPVTTIDGAKKGSVVVFKSGEGPDSVIQGFTITNGNGEGGGIYCLSSSPSILGNCIINNSPRGILCTSNSSPVIQGNVIKQNHGGMGAGIRCENSSPKIVSNIVWANDSGALTGGAGIICRNMSSPLIANTIVFENTGAHGGGIQAVDSSPVIVNSTVSRNSSGVYPGDGIHVCGRSSLTLVNSVVWGNGSKQSNLVVESSSIATVSYSNIQGGWIGTGNINADPLFVNGIHGDFHLRNDSPCRDKGLKRARWLLKTDFEGDPRIAGGEVDIGADEFYPHLYHTGNPTPGKSIEVKIIGQPGSSTIWSYSLDPQILEPPLAIPGLKGILFLKWPFFLVPLQKISSSGVSQFTFNFPSNFPVQSSFPTQALIGLQLSNAEVIDVR